jgi:broad-specificity NMP kinase
MGTFLITGASGAGKTAVGLELRARGHAVVDTDDTLAYYGRLDTLEPIELPRTEELTEDWYARNGWLWSRDKLDAALDHRPGDVFFCGGAVNEAEFYPRFSEIFLLHVDARTLTKRLAERGHDSHTNNAAFLRQMVEYLADYDALARLHGMTIIETGDMTISEVAALILLKTQGR